MSARETTSRRVGKATAVTVRRRVEIMNERGLHARAAAKFAKTAGAFKAKITITKGEYTVSALSIMGLMMLAAAPGSALELEAIGPDAGAAIEALAALVANRFEEDDAPA
ncbi:MAG: HPr family phosphocarrier protein [Rhodospirillales bacterium]|nr:HPr family phosphocarrier protein [Rhodospirillales bacterium]